MARSVGMMRRRVAALGVATCSVFLLGIGGRPAAHPEPIAPSSGETHVAADSVAHAQRAEGRMVRVPGGVFGMGITKRELGDLRGACAVEFGRELAEAMCQDPGASTPSRFQDAYTGDALRRVTVGAFDIDRFEVTVREYRRCVTEGACDPTPLVSGDLRFVHDPWPMVNVTWFDAVAYCAHQGKRLPTEAEWEKTARGTDGRRWPWGMVDRDRAANRGQVEPEVLRPPVPMGGASFDPDPSDGANVMVAPGTFGGGRSPYGAHDMAGNVSEWIADWYSQAGYEKLSRVDPTGPDADPSGFRVVRGGSYDLPRFFARTYYRHADSPERRSASRGFRCARTVLK